MPPPDRLPASIAGLDGVSFLSCPELRGDLPGGRIEELRTLRDYLHYLEPPFDASPKLRARALRKLVKAMSDGTRRHLVAHCPHCQTALVDEDITRTFAGDAASRLGSLLSLVEGAIPSDRRIEALLRAERPDVMIVTPLVRVGSHQTEYVKSAKAIGVPVVFPVFSWDNLSTKGLMHEIPDWVLVWNDWQRSEAVEIHHVPADRVVVTGAPRFDRFFAMQPKVGRDRFCRKRGFDPRQPILTYLCSSNFVAESERQFVLRWIDHVRRIPALEGCGIVIRPHPREKAQWRAFTPPDERVTLSRPRAITGEQSLYDTLHHSAAVVGLNTSAEIEAGIVGRPVLTVLSEEFAGGQEGTVHFHYLRRERGGFVEVAPDLEAHGRQLAAAVAGQYDRLAIRSSIERFVRPHGIERRATPIMVDAIERIGHARAPRAEVLAGRAWRVVRTQLAGLRRRASGS